VSEPGDAVAATRRVAGAAAAVGGSIGLAAALARRDYMTSSWSDDGRLPWLEERDIALFRGTGRLDGADRRGPGRRRLDRDAATG